MSSAIDPELVICQLMATLTEHPVGVTANPDSPSYIVQILDVETPLSAPHGLLWVVELQITTAAADAASAFTLAGELQDALLEAADENYAQVNGLGYGGAEVIEHPLRTVTDKTHALVVAAYAVTVSAPTT